MSVKAMGVTLGLAALLGVTSWAGAGSQAVPQSPLRPALSDRAVGPASPALVTAASRPDAAPAALATQAPGPRTQAPDSEQRRTVFDSYGRLPLSFIENQGQADARIAYYVQSPGRSLYFTRDGHALRLTQGKGDHAKGHTIKVELVGAAAERVESLKRAPGIVSYFKGPKDHWKTAIPTHSRIGYVQPWPGIDLAYDGHGGRLESIYTVAPHADPAQIKLRYSGHDSLRLDAQGNLVYTTSLGEITETAPVLYQEIGGSRVAVEGRFVLLDAATVAFEVSHYNPDHALVIDPTLIYAGYIGGSGRDVGAGIAVDGAGNAYVTGSTDSTQATFPETVGPDLTHNGDRDAFVAKVNAAGTALVYAGYIGGDLVEDGTAIAVDGAGNAYVTGNSFSDETTFPVFVGPDLTFNGASFQGDAFVAKVNPAGTALVYAGYIGGSGNELGRGIAVDSAGNAYVTGTTSSTATTFPVTVGPDLTHNGGTNDAYVAKVNPAGTALVYAGYIGGNGADLGFGIAVDSAGNAYVTGDTNSTEATFPVLDGPDLTYNLGANDVFVAKVNPAGTALVYASYIGGSGNDQGRGIAVDSAGNAYVTGSTDSTHASFPVLGGPDLTYNGSFSDAFVAKIGAAVATVDLQGNVAVGGAPVVGAEVKLKNKGTGVKVASATDGAGAYQFHPVAAGTYKISIGTFVVGAPTTVSGNLTVKGAPSIGTKVKLKNKTTSVVLTTTTDASGNFSFAGVTAGTHKVTFPKVTVP